MPNIKRALVATGAIIGSALTLTGTATSAYAEPVVVTGERADPQLQSRVIRFGDLNISTEAGEKRLLHRVGYAVKDICGFYETALTVTTAERACQEQAWSGARPQIADAVTRARSGQLAALSSTIRVTAR